MRSKRILRVLPWRVLGLVLSSSALSLAQAEAPIEITVEGQPRHPNQPSRDPYVAGSVVRGESLSAPGVSAADLLRTQAGVQVTELGGFGAPATASIRGATSAQTPVYLGGVRLNDEVGGVANLSAIPLWLIERIEVYRGNAPLDASELGIGGAIYFEPRRPRHDELGAGAGAGSFGTRTAFVRGSLGTDGQRALFGVEASRTDNDYAYESDGGTAFLSSDDGELRQTNTDVRRLDAWLLTRSDFERGAVIDSVVNIGFREQGVPRLALSPSTRTRARFERGLAAVRARMPLGAREQHLLTLQTSIVSSSVNYDDPESVLAFLAPSLEIVGQRVEQRMRASWQLNDSIELQSGLDAAAERLWRRDGRRVPEAHVGGAGRAVLGIQWEFLPGLSARALGAAECQTRSVSEASCHELLPVGRLGLGMRRGPLLVFANAGRYARFPGLGELHGAGILVRGNPRLEPELGETVDAGLRFETPRKESLHVWGDATAFLRWADQLIGYVRSPQGYVVPRNFEAARVGGLELSAGSQFEKLVRASVALTLTEPRDTTPQRGRANDVLPMMSRLVFVPTLGLRTPEIDSRVFEQARLDAEWVHRSNRYADAAGLVVLPGDDTLSLTLAVDWFSELLVTRARVENVLGCARFDVVGYPLPSRSAFVSAELSWP